MTCSISIIKSNYVLLPQAYERRRGLDRMVVGLTTTNAISAYHQ